MTYCPDDGKIRYASRRAAKLVRRRMRGPTGHLNAYKCGEFWHLGRLPVSVISGGSARSDIPTAAEMRRADR